VILWTRGTATTLATLPASSEHALKESATAAAPVLGPWNGTGTTTVVAASKNVPAIGFDVNPALVVVSRARQASVEPLGDPAVVRAGAAA
jgi:hypothetical protein